MGKKEVIEEDVGRVAAVVQRKYLGNDKVHFSLSSWGHFKHLIEHKNEKWERTVVYDLQFKQMKYLSENLCLSLSWMNEFRIW